MTIFVDGEYSFADELEEAENRRAIVRMNSELEAMPPLRPGLGRVQVLTDPHYNDPPSICAHIACCYDSGLTRLFTLLSKEAVVRSLTKEDAVETDLWWPTRY